MAVPAREAHLLEPVAAHLERRGFDLLAEVDVNGRIADLVGFGPEGLIAVELKLTDWRGALRQAMAYQVGVERSYVALPLDTAMTVVRRASGFEAEGVGLLAVHPPDASVREILPARPSARHLPFVADRLRTLFRTLAR